VPVAELRKVLDARDENLRSLMTQLEQGLKVQGGVKPAPDKKNSEPAKVEELSVGHECSFGVGQTATESRPHRLDGTHG